MQLRDDDFQKIAALVDDALLAYQENPSEINKAELIKSLEITISLAVSRYRGLGIPEAALRAKAEKIVIDAIGSYKPGRAGFKTWVNQQLLQMSRFVNDSQFISIPEARRQKIMDFNLEKSNLALAVGREPNMEEIAKATRMPLSDVRRMEQELRGVVPASAMGFSMNSGKEDDLLERKLYAVYSDLTGDERVVFEYLFGYGGKEATTIATKISMLSGIPYSRVNSLRLSIRTKIGMFFHGDF